MQNDNKPNTIRGDNVYKDYLILLEAYDTDLFSAMKKNLRL